MDIKKLEVESGVSGPSVFQSVTYAPTIKQKKVSAEATMNVVLWIIFAVLFLAIISSYFVKDAGEILIEIRDFAVQALWLTVGSYSMGEICKIIFINKAHTTETYVSKKQETEKELSSLTDEQLEKRFEYCKDYEQTAFETQRDRLLKSVSIDLKTYESKYQTLNKRELLSRYPNDNLSKAQIKVLQAIRKIKPVHYNPDFLNTTVKTNSTLAPSEMYDADKENGKNIILSMIFTFFSGAFAVSVAAELIFSFTPAALFAALVKTAITLITVAMKARFGWNLVMRTEINRFCLQISEVKNLKRYCEKHK